MLLKRSGNRPKYQRLRAAAISAARRNNAALYFSEDPVLGPELGGSNTYSLAAWGATNVSTSVPTGKVYLLELSVQAGATGEARLLYNAAGDATTAATAGVTKRVVANLTNATVAIQGTASGFSGTATISVREILNADLYGYQDAAGTLPSYLGGPMGLWLDKSYGLERGDELVTNGDFSNGTAGWGSVDGTGSYTNVGLSVSGGVITCTGSVGIRLSQSRAFVVGKTYEITADVNSATVAVSLHIAAGNDLTSPFYAETSSTTPRRARAVWTATNASAFIGLRCNSAGSFSADNISVRELKGVHLTQATAGAKPTGARVPKKLGPELVVNGNGSSLDGWTTEVGGTYSVATNEFSVTADGTNKSLYQTVSVAVGRPYEISVGKNTGFVYAYDTQSTNTNLLAGFPLSGVAGKVVVASASGYIRIRLYSAASTTSLFDNISVREVLEWSPVLSCDGGDSLAAPSSIIGSNLSQPYTMIASGNGPSGNYKAFIGETTRLLSTGVGGNLYLSNSGNNITSASGIVVAGAPLVVSATWASNVGAIYKDGVSVINGAMAAPGAAPSATAVGQKGNNTDYNNAQIDLICIAPSVMPDADRKAIERFAAFRLAITYAG